MPVYQIVTSGVDLTEEQRSSLAADITRTTTRSPEQLNDMFPGKYAQYV